MVVLRTFLALVAGFATTALLIVIMTALLKKLTPSWAAESGHPNVGSTVVNLGYAFLAAAAGGYVTAWMARANPLVHVLALAITVLLLAALSALQQRGPQPMWYMLTMVALTSAGVLAGGLVRLRVMGVL